MIKIQDGPRGWWFNGHAFGEDRELTKPVQDLDALRRVLIARSFNLNRWQGQAGPKGPVSVGLHSLIVADFAESLARARDLPDPIARLARRFGATHDLGETLGMGDIAAPWLRSGKIPDAVAMCELHQAAVNELFAPKESPGPGAIMAASQVVKDADRAAAAVERRAFFDDATGDCEHHSADATIREIGEEDIGIVIARACDLRQWMSESMADQIACVGKPVLEVMIDRLSNFAMGLD